MLPWGPPHDLSKSIKIYSDSVCFCEVLGCHTKITFLFFSRGFQPGAPGKMQFEGVNCRRFAHLSREPRKRGSTHLFNTGHELRRIRFIKPEAPPRRSNIVPKPCLKAGAPMFCPGSPMSGVNSVMSSMTFLGCSFPVQSSTTFMQIPHQTQ